MTPPKGPTANSKPHYHGHRERLRERLRQNANTLADYELLELLLGYVIKRQDTKPLAKELLSRFGSVRGVFLAEDNELLNVDGFGPASVDFFTLWREVLARFEESSLPDKPVLDHPGKLAAMARARMGHLRVEEFWVALVDAGNRLLAWERLFRGTVGEAPAYPREILALALQRKAFGLILVHNHPGGQARPSSGDIELTQAVQRAAIPMGLRVQDHIIVTENAYYSFREHEMI